MKTKQPVSFIPAEALEDKRLDGIDIFVLMALSLYSDYDGWCEVTHKTLGCGRLSRSSVIGGLQRLAECGYIEAHRPTSPNQTGSRYRLVHVASPDEITFALKKDPKWKRQTGAPNNPIRQQLWEKQEGCCWYCGCRVGGDHEYQHSKEGDWLLPAGIAFAEIEHQNPRSRGGTNCADNLVLACIECNRGKEDRTVDEYRAWLESRCGEPVRFHGEPCQ